MHQDGLGLLQTTVTYSDRYNFDDEDPACYSDLEEPWPFFTHEEYPDIRKNIKDNVNIPFVVDVTEQAKALKAIAGLVQQQKVTLEGVGVAVPAGAAGFTPSIVKDTQSAAVPSTSQEFQPQPEPQPEPPVSAVLVKPKITGSVPKAKFPALKPKVLSCPVCHKHFSQHSKVVEHYVTHTKTSEFTCDICQLSFTTQLALTNHGDLHNKFKCPLSHTCAYYFDSLELLQQHLDASPEWADIDKKTVCPKCLHHFANRENMKKHLKHRCHKNPDVEIEFLYCKFCSARHRERKYLNSHEKKCAIVHKGKRGGKGGGKGGRGGRGRGRGGKKK